MAVVPLAHRVATGGHRVKTAGHRVSTTGLLVTWASRVLSNAAGKSAAGTVDALKATHAANSAEMPSCMKAFTSCLFCLLVPTSD